MRCRALLLKSEEMSSARVGEQTAMTAQSVNGWVKRFETGGIKGLRTRPGQGRKPVMESSDEEAVRKAIESDRQSVRAAKEAWQKVIIVDNRIIKLFKSDLIIENRKIGRMNYEYESYINLLLTASINK
jgi:transposase